MIHLSHIRLLDIGLRERVNYSKGIPAGNVTDKLQTVQKLKRAISTCYDFIVQT